MLYTAPVWAGALVFKTNIDIIQRTIALRVAMVRCLYIKIVSTVAIMVAEFIPAQLLDRERQIRYAKRAEPEKNELEKVEREETYRLWQEVWDVAETVRWTWRLIKKVK